MPPIGQSEQHRFIHIIVYQHYTVLRRAYQTINKTEWLKHIAVIKGSLNSGQGGTHKEVYFLLNSTNTFQAKKVKDRICSSGW